MPLKDGKHKADKKSSKNAHQRMIYLETRCIEIEEEIVNTKNN